MNINHMLLRVALLGLAMIAPDSQVFAESYILSQANTSYEHLVRGGVNVAPISNTYTVNVPGGYSAKVYISEAYSHLVHCESGHIDYLVNGTPKTLLSTNTFTSSGVISLSATASSPSVSWTEMYIDYYMTIAGVQTPHYSHRYHYYDTYYMDCNYVIKVDYITPVMVSFETNGGESLSSRSYWTGESYGTLPTPTRSGYKFKGWYSNQALTASVTATSKVSASVTKLYAKWAECRSVAFETNGGGSVSSRTYVIGESFGSLPTPTRSGYKFLGWYSNSALTVKVTTSSVLGDSTTTLYAKWAELIEISFVSNGGSPVSSREYVIGETYGSLPTPTWAAHTFQGWYSNSGLTARVDATDVVVASVATLYAKWTENHPNFTINANGVLTKAVLNGCSDIVLPDTVTTIGEGAFKNCTSLRTIIMPNVTYISASAFLGCSSLTSIEIPEEMTTIPNEAFSGCSMLRTVKIPDGVKEINYHAFYNCTSLATTRGVIVADGWACGYTSGLSGALDLTGCRGIGRCAFEGCAKITSVHIPNVPMNDYAFVDCTGLVSVTFDDDIESLPYGVFANCTKLASVTLPKQLEVIPDLAFGRNSTGDITEIQGCLFTSIVIPDSVKQIGSSAFQHCKRLTSITIPEHVVSVDLFAFMGCSALKTLSIYSSNLEFDDGSFYYYPQPTINKIYVYGENWPKGSKWLFANRQTDSGRNTSCTVYARAFLKSKTLPAWITGAGLSVSYLTGESVDLVFDSCGGSEVAGRTCTEGSAYGTLPTPVRQGHVFQGWKSKSGAIVKTTDVVSPFDKLLTAEWTPETHAVTLDRQDGGVGASVVTATFGEELPKVPVPQKLNYAFDGYWSEPNGGGVQYYARDGVGIRIWNELSDRTLYASWVEKNWGVADYLHCGMDIPFASMGDAEWIPDIETSHDGVGSMRSGPIGASAIAGGRTQSVMTTTVLGEGTGSFWWKVSSEPQYYEEYYDYAVFLVDGEEVAKIAGETEWARVDYSLSGDGEHVLMWVFFRDDFDEPDASYWNCVWVDDFTWNPKPVTLTLDSNGATEGVSILTVARYAGFATVLPGEGAYAKTMCELTGWSDGKTVYAPGETYVFGADDVTLTAVWRELSWTLAEAVGAEGLVLTTGGDSEWEVDPNVFRSDKVSLRSGAITHSQETWVETTVVGPGELSFWWKVSGEVNRSRIYDYAKVTLDGVTVYSSGDTDWENLMMSVTGSGNHVVRWTYLKNASVDAGDDCAWLDDVLWMPSADVDPIPDLSADATPSEVAAALEGSEDVRLAANITDVTVYGAYREWAMKIGAAEVKASSFAWASFATDSAALLVKMPTDDDLKIEEFSPSVTAGAFEFTVSVRDVKVGDKASENNLKKLFGLEGAASLDPSEFSMEKVAMDFKNPQDGKLKFTAAPLDKNTKSFFMKMRVK